MPSFDFKPRFVPQIKANIKLSTIRSTERCKVGDIMHLYTGLRTKDCKLIARRPCVLVTPFHITEHQLISCSHPDAGYIWRQEGFDSPKDMLDFFGDLYGFPYSGFLHQWSAQ